MNAPLGFLVDSSGNPISSMGMAVDPSTGAPTIVTRVAGSAVATPVGTGGSGFSGVQWTAASNTLASGVAPPGGSYIGIVQDPGVFAAPAALASDTPFLRSGDMILWAASLTKYVRSAGRAFAVAVNGPLTLNDAHDDCLLVCSGAPALTLGAGRMVGFGVKIRNACTVVSTGLTFTDERVSTGNASGPSYINQLLDTNTYFWGGGKL